MNKKLRFSLLMLLLAVFSGAWAGESEVYNFTFTKQSGASNYASTYNVTIGGHSWTIPGNLTNGDYLRIGGKSISEVDRVVQCNDALTGNISRIVFNHNGKSRANIVVHSVTLTVANDVDFSDAVDEVVVSNPTVEKETVGEIVFEPSANVEWSGDLYYRFTINVSNPDSSNGGFDLTSLVFYENVAGAVDPSVSFANESVTIEIGETVTNELTKPNDLAVTYSSDPTTVATVDENGVVTGVAEGEATITASWEAVADKYNAGSVSYTVTVSPVIPAVNFVKVTNGNQIVAGNEYILVGTKGSSIAAMGKRTGTNTYRERVEVTVNEDKVAVKEGDGIAVLTLGGSSDAWTFLASDNNEYLALTANSNALHSSSDATLESSQWTITEDFQVKNGAYSRYIQYNSGSTRFACYTSGQGTATLYVKMDSDINEKTAIAAINSIEPSELNVNDSGNFTVSLTPADESLVDGEDYEVTYSTESDLIMLDADGSYSTGEETGSAVITVTVTAQDGDIYYDVTKDFTVNIVAPVEFAEMVYGCELYQKVTSNDQLEAGRRYLIVYDGNAPFGDGFEVFNGVNDSDLGKVVNFSNDANFANKIIDARGLSDITPVALQTRSDGKWYIQAEGQFLTYNKPAGTSGNNKLFSVEDYNEVGTLWTIDVEGSRLITNAYNNERSLQYNYNNGNSRFACYASAQSDVAIYKELLDVPVLNLSENDTEQQEIESGVYPIVNFTYAVKAGWNTVAMPFEGIDITDIMSDVKVYEFTGLSDEGDLNFSEFTGEFEAGKPYVFYSESETESNEHEFTDVNVIYEMGVSNEYFFSTLCRMPMAGLYGVVPSTGQIKKGGANSFIKGFRGYFDLPAEAGEAVQAVFHNEDGTTTAIKAVEILNDLNGDVYDLSGRKVSGNLQPGVYVKDGKKVVVK